jgi:hypothetical protein
VNERSASPLLVRGQTLRLGLGLPLSWQGWAVLVVWMAAVWGGSAWLVPRSLPLFALFTAAMVASLVAVYYLKGEPRRLALGRPGLTGGASACAKCGAERPSKLNSRGARGGG